MHRTDPDPGRILRAARLAERAWPSSLTQGWWLVSECVVCGSEPANVLNYTEAFTERQLKRSLKTRAWFDRLDLLFDGPFTIIRSFGLAVQEGARLNDERSRVGTN